MWYVLVSLVKNEYYLPLIEKKLNTLVDDGIDPVPSLAMF